MRKIKGSPQPFGVDIKGKNINFAVQVAKGKTCELLLYKRGKEVPEYQFDMPEEEGVGEVRFLSGFLEEKKKLKENVIIQKHQPPKLKTNGELFFENLSLLQKTNPIAYEHQKQKDEYDLKQLTRKRHQNKINAYNIGFKK